MLVIWYAHYTFFRRYGLEDGPTIVLNAVLLFLVLFYVYPLKFMFGAMVESVFGLGPGLAGSMTRAQGSVLLIVYGAGFVAVFLTLTLLYYRAWRARDRLDLDALERYDTRTSLEHYSLYVLIGLLSVVDRRDRRRERVLLGGDDLLPAGSGRGIPRRAARQEAPRGRTDLGSTRRDPTRSGRGHGGCAATIVASRPRRGRAPRSSRRARSPRRARRAREARGELPLGPAGQDPAIGQYSERPGECRRARHAADVGARGPRKSRPTRAAEERAEQAWRSRSRPRRSRARCREFRRATRA